MTKTRSAALSLFALAAVLGPPTYAQAPKAPAKAAAPAPVADRLYSAQVVRSYPHDPSAFTEGLLYEDGVLYESTGMVGRSFIRKSRLETGQVLLSKDSDVKMHPSSMSKLMTVYIVFKNLKDGKIKLTDTYRVSEKAWRTQGSKMFVHVGDQVPLEDLLHGIITQSGNDSCIVVAEGISGSEEAFAELMTRTAKELGMENSNFVNATGWPLGKLAL